MKKFIGERLISVTLPWDGDCECEDDSMILEFESGSIRILTKDYSQSGYPQMLNPGGRPSICWEKV